MTSQKTVRILCVDDHALLIDGLETRLALEKDFEFAGRRSSAKGLIPVVKELHPDIVVMDIDMPGPDAFETASEVVRTYPDVKVVILSAFVRDRYLSAAHRAGAWGYFAKGDETSDIVSGLRRVAHGEFALGPKVQQQCKPVISFVPGYETGHSVKTRLDTLTSREREVLCMIGRGMSRAEIADAITRSPKTVDGHREKIMLKLDVHSVGELVRFAIREGLVEP